MQTFTLTLPQIIQELDHRDFTYIERVFKKNIHSSIVVEEVGFSPSKGAYFAVMYSSLDMPNDETIYTLLKDQSVTDLSLV